MPRGTDPHAFEPTPQDAAALADADVLFMNGVGLEAFLAPLLQSAAEGVSAIPVSYGIALLRSQGVEEHAGEFDPHVWFDPRNVVVWTQNIERALSTLDPAGAEAYLANASAYEAQLQALDAWIEEQVAQVAPEKRRLVTDHASFSYFARRYGFEQVGAVFPGYSTLTEPSAQDIARLEDAIRQLNVQAVFVGLTVNPSLARRVAADTGTSLVFLYSGSLSESGGPADSYLALMRFNASAIVAALR
jgi:ABC-type Zn uptake system ZnuABC Zn-binding protein ZnuA